MGSVADLYTTGDNDPEIHPRKFYRHYMYCDACGSFELGVWLKPSNHQVLEKRSSWLQKAALYFSPLVLVSAQQALGLVLPFSLLMILVAGISAVLVFWGYFTVRWDVVKKAIPWLLLVLVAEWLLGFLTVFVEPWMLLVGTVVVLGGLLAVRENLISKIEHVGLQCRQCGATYAHGTPFFTDLDANPLDLTIAEVPRPLGVSHFEVGKSVD